MRAIVLTVRRCTSVQFVDTNVLLYAISTEPAEAEKARVAVEILSRAELGLSTQVLQEFYVQATRATRSARLSHEQATDLVEAFTRFTVQPVTVEIVRAALNLRGRHSLSYWDAAIIEAARTLRCTEILSEDLSADENYDGLRVINPFTTRD